MGALEGLRVLEIGQWIAAPYCAAILADLGADVIKVERPGTGDDQRLSPPYVEGQSALFNQVNRNKRSIALNLDSSDGRLACLELAARADVVISNFRPGTMARLGIAYEAIAERNPRVIYSLITGFGTEGPLSAWAGMDLIAQAMSGIMQLAASPDGRPGKVPMAVADISTGLFSAIGILAALAARERTGRGQVVDLSLLDSMLAMMPMETASFFATGRNPPPFHRRETANAAPYQVFATRDGHIALAAASQPLWQALCGVVGREDLGADVRFATSGERIRNVKALETELVPLFAGATSANWLTRLEAARIPASPVLALEEILTHEHLAARGTSARAPSGPVACQPVIPAPIRMSDTSVRLRCSAPSLGQDTTAILDALGATQEWPRHART